METQPTEDTVIKPVPPDNSSLFRGVAICVAAALLLFAFIGGAALGNTTGYKNGYADGVRDTSATGPTSYQVEVAQVDPGADTSKYPGVSDGDFIIVKVSALDFWKLQRNAVDQTLCLPGNVALSTMVTQQNMASTDCGAAIRVVLIQPR